MAARIASDNFIESIDPGLLPYKEEIYRHAVSSEETLRFLRPREVREMAIPEVYKRMLIDRIVKLQTPESKIKMKSEAGSPDGAPTMAKQPKRLDFETHEVDKNQKKVGDSDRFDSSTRRPDTPNVNDKNYLDNELDKLRDERDSLHILLVHRKNSLKDLHVVPDSLHPVAIPGGVLTKTVCDKCHHRGHKATGNRGGRACPFDKCLGYNYCGILAKHKDYKAMIQEAEKEVAALEKDVRINEDKINGLQTFLQTNTTNFVKMVKPRLQLAFLAKYKGKDGNQLLQRDLRYIKLATQGKIPSNITSISPAELENLIKNGKKTVSAKFKLDNYEKPVCFSETSGRDSQETNEVIQVNESDSRLYSYGSPSLLSPANLGIYSYNSPQQQPSQLYPYWYTAYNPGVWYGTPASQPSACTATVSKAPETENEIFPPLPPEEYPPLPPLPQEKCDN
ncbi:uncharacterized protein LOC117323489 [Pecten maximus]|uniref:uncharacterized protein LOC117323489 n=1 Tax=Pecten maximus TaxID=6579 RepID=UPI001458201E|nr:uncharacterized protein LOC117323489 [Pecten maximus]